MGGIGHGDRKSIERRKEEYKGRFTDRDFSNLESPEPGFGGFASSSNVPQKIEFVDQDNSQAETGDQETSPSLVYQKADELEIQYEILSPSELNGLALLDALEEDKDTSDFSFELVELMYNQGLLETSEQELQPSTRGEQVYNNWTGFRDNYLTGNTEVDDNGKNRFDVIESEIGENSMPWFLEESSNVDVTFDQYLSRKEHSRSGYNPESEFESMIGALHGYKQSELGQRVRALEVLNNPEDYEEHEVSDNIRHEFRHATPLGLVDDDEVLTQDGEALYQKVQADALYMGL